MELGAAESGTGLLRSFETWGDPFYLILQTFVLPREVVHRLGLLPRHRKEFRLTDLHTIPCMATWMVIVRSRDLH